MVFTVNLKQLSFKQDISSVRSMISDQKSTYAILRYAHDIPTSAYSRAMNMLLASDEHVEYRKLKGLIKQYGAARGIGMVMDEEFVETVECWTGFKDDNDIVIDGMPMTIEVG